MSTLGWVSSPTGRGTLDIIWSCTVTITLCCWSSLCLNAPSRGEAPFWQLCDKFHLASIGILGPENLFLLALGQYESASRSVKQFHAAGYRSWTMHHAFLADMGGFLLQAPVQQPCSELPAALNPRPLSFPIDASQLFYLLDHGYIDFPNVEEEEIGQADRLARCITIVQVIWFSINSVGRAVQHLQLTTLELTTLAYIPCMILTSMCWYHKPSSNERGRILKCKVPLADILKAAGDEACDPYRNTPLDFVSREEWTISLLWAHDLTILRKLHIPLFSRRIKTRPVSRISNDNWPKIGHKGLFVAAVVCLIYSSIFVAGWNFPFPTRVELVLWRVSSLGTLSFIVLMGPFMFPCFFRYGPGRQQRSREGTSKRRADEMVMESKLPAQHMSWYCSQTLSEQARRMAARWRNNSPDRDPALEVPLRVLLPTTLLCASYSVFRMYFLVEDVVGLRRLPASAFETVAWPNWFPHV